ncbi:MAG: glutamine--fructose-6-phosphate transaminase (isomerizing) [Anaerolineales bacterium]|nr:MAG: glutamine--fructose-6-phosphate transaminase (isomerizing) [Anaerolineales bacterium]
MCGIFGIISKDEQVLGPILTNAAQRLSYRGYDSVGCATITKGGLIDLRKDVGKVDEVAPRLNFAEMVGSRGITQLRWATFGSPSPENSQPHIDSKGLMVGAHNGNVVNNLELRQQFISEGMLVRSENDGETCVHAVERYVNQGYDLIDAIRKAYNDLLGDYSFVIGKIGEEKLYAFKKGSGLVAGITGGATCVSSDLPSILPITRRVLFINDGEIVILQPDQIDIRSVKDGSVIRRDFELITESMELAQKGGYAHFMLKEIHEQSQVARELLHMLDNSTAVEPMAQRLLNARHLYLIGCGTSFHACSIGAYYIANLAAKPAIPVLATQFTSQYGPTLGPQDVGIFVSQSGETKDVLNALAVARNRGMQCFGLVNVIGSTLMKTTELHLPLTCGYEISVPATKTYTNQVITFLYLALKMGNLSTVVLSTLPEMIDQTVDDTNAQINRLEDLLDSWNDSYCLGYGSTYPIALEGALKLKEVTDIHCEGLLSTEFKHGPLAVVRSGYPIIFLAGPEDIPLIVSGINEVACRGARTIVIGEEDSRLRANAHEMITIPSTGPLLTPILAIIPMQLLAYHVSVGRGFDPDYPRNLSKTLTVD